MSLLCRLKNLVHKGILKEKDLERIVIIPKGQEPCEDCISRKEAIKMMEYYHDDCAKTSEYTRLGFETAIEVVKSLPSIQPKSKTEVLDKIRAEINSPNRGTCDYFIVDRIEEIINKYKAESEG